MADEIPETFTGPMDNIIKERYKLQEAAEMAAQNDTAGSRQILRKLKYSVREGVLDVFRPGSNVRYEPGADDETSAINKSNALRSDLNVLAGGLTWVDLQYDKQLLDALHPLDDVEAWWDDLNNWLKNHQPRITYRFPDPANIVAGKMELEKNTALSATPGSLDPVMPAEPPVAEVKPDNDKIRSDLFDPVPVEVLEKMFPTGGKWKRWAERAARNGLKDARKNRGMFNPYEAALWFLRQGIDGWDLARCERKLRDNLPARSHDEAHLFTGNLD